MCRGNEAECCVSGNETYLYLRTIVHCEREAVMFQTGTSIYTGYIIAFTCLVWSNGNIFLRGGAMINTASNKGRWLWLACIWVWPGKVKYLLHNGSLLFYAATYQGRKLGLAVGTVVSGIVAETMVFVLSTAPVFFIWWDLTVADHNVTALFCRYVQNVALITWLIDWLLRH